MEGFIIYPTYRIENDKSYVYLYGRLKNGKSFLTKNYFKPYFFIRSHDLKKAQSLGSFESQKTEYKNFKDEKLTKIILDIPSQVSDLRKVFEENFIDCFEADIRFEYRFLIDNGLLGSIKIKGKSIKGEKTDLFFDEPQFENSEWRPKVSDLKILSFDIETSMDQNTLYCISLKSNDEELNKVLIVSEENHKNAKSFKDEKSLLLAFKKELEDYDPDVITGWNVIDFDLLVIKEKFAHNKILFDIGRSDEECDLKIIDSFIKDSKANIIGRVVLDGIQLLKSSFINLDDYKLSTASEVFAKEDKLIEDENKGKEIEDAYKNNKQKLIDYNLKDSDLVLKILNNSGVLQLTILRSILTGMPLNRVKASIASFDSVYLKELRKKGYVAKTTGFTSGEKTTGGYVMEPNPGIYNFVGVFDFKSLYPSIMMTFNIDPLAHRPKCEAKNGEALIVAPNKTCFAKGDAILPTILKKLFEERQKATDKGDKVSRQAIKILMNSMYGVLASPNCRFYSFEMANAITSFGHEIIKNTAKIAKRKGFEPIYGDSVTKDSEIIIQYKGEVKRVHIEELFSQVDKKSDEGKEYNFKQDVEILTIDSKGKSVFKPVKYVMRHKCNKKIFRVNLTSNWHIDVTEDHGLIGYESFAFNNSKKDVMNRLIEVKPEEIGKKASSLVSLKKVPEIKCDSKNLPLEVYEFLGYFIGDGSFRRNNYANKLDKDYYLGLSLGNDVDEVIRKLISPLKKKGFIKTLWRSKSRKGDITINGLKLMELVSEHCREKDGSKKFPSFILNESIENKAAFLRGLFSADGTVILRRGSPIIRLTTISTGLVSDVRKLLFDVGVSNSSFEESNTNTYETKEKIYSTRSKSKHVVIKDKHSFNSKVGFLLRRKNDRAQIKSENVRKKNISDKEFDIQSVKSVEVIDYDDYVYDVEVEEVHRFFANNILVHNTDSTFIQIPAKDFDEAQKIGVELQEDINDYYKNKIKEEYGVESYLVLEFEKLFIKLFMPTTRGSGEGAKKRYAGLVKREGIEKIEFTGLEFVRRDWTDLSKKFQLELLQRVFDEKPLDDWIRTFVKELKEGKYDDLLVYRKALRKNLDAYTKTTPPHVKAARKLDEIKSNLISYIMTVNGPEPLEKIESSIDYDHYIEKQIKPLADSLLVFYNKSFKESLKPSKQFSLDQF